MYIIQLKKDGLGEGEDFFDEQMFYSNGFLTNVAMGVTTVNQFKRDEVLQRINFSKFVNVNSDYIQVNLTTKTETITFKQGIVDNLEINLKQELQDLLKDPTFKLGSSYGIYKIRKLLEGPSDSLYISIPGLIEYTKLQNFILEFISGQDEDITFEIGDLVEYDL